MEKVIYIDKRQKEFTTKVAKEAMEENKRIKQSKKDRIKEILKEAGFDPKERYTASEKRKFTRIVKNKLFTKSVPVTLTDEQCKERCKQRVIAKKARLDALPYARLEIKPGKQRGATAAELSVKEEPKERKFRYSIQRKREGDSMRTYDFLTDNFIAKTNEEAKKKAAKLAKKYVKDTSFAGITVQDIEGDNNITYYTRNKLLAA